jgi:hypothetical protein
MDIYRQAEALLRRAGYRTSRGATSTPIVLSFEDHVIVGFLGVFETAAKLLAEWRGVERANLVRYARQLRSAPDKAWNVYSVFFTEDPGTDQDSIESDRIEEDFSSTRKVVRLGVSTMADLERALLPVLPLKALTTFTPEDYEIGLRDRLRFLPDNVLHALFGLQNPDEIARLMIDSL